MKGLQHTKGQDLQKPFPGCMGRMITMFDLAAVPTGTKLLGEKAHRDDDAKLSKIPGRPVGRNQSEASKMAIDPVAIQREDKQTKSELRKNLPNNRSGGTPIKMLIEEEMEKEGETEQKPTNLVARLMGLNAFPVQQSVGREYLCGGMAGKIERHEQQWQNNCPSNRMPQKNQPCPRQSKECKDVCRAVQNPSRTNGRRHNHSDETYENRMALVRQKFDEAKRLVTDEKLLHSKEFQDILHFLGSNRDLFLKFLEEPNCLLSSHLHELQAITAPSETKQITVLKPSETIRTRGNNLVGKQLYQNGNEVDKHEVFKTRGNNLDGHENKHCRSSSFTRTGTSTLSQPTRIVLLKPSPEKPRGPKTMATAVSAVDSGLGDGEITESRKASKVTTWHMHVAPKYRQREETLSSSIDVNGYTGDDSSVNKSDSENMEEESDDASDWEIATPTSHRSWDYTSRIASPYSVSSFRQTRHSRESSVSREAKKRLLERWATVSSTSCNQEQRGQRSTSTLGDVLTIHEKKKEEMNDVGIALGDMAHKQDVKEQVTQLSRSKSAPYISSPCEGIEFTDGASDSFSNNPGVAEEAVKLKSGKSSFREKVSSFFSSKNKKILRENSGPSTSLLNGRSGNGSSDASHKVNEGLSACVVDSPPNKVHSTSPEKNLGTYHSAASCYDIQDKGTIPTKDVSSIERLATLGNYSEAQDQPSPVSVLEAPFIGEHASSLMHPSDSTIAAYPKALCRSPLIESVVRSLSWDSFQSEATSPNSSRLSRLFSKADEEQNWLQFIQKLVTSAGLDGESLNGAEMRWHSLSTPLSPQLLDKVVDYQMERVKSKERRAKERLLFDSVSEALMDIGQITMLTTYPWTSRCGSNVKELRTDSDTPLAQEIWQVVRSWSAQDKYLSSDGGDKSIGVELVVKREVVGSVWVDMMWLEKYEINKEICGLMLEELVEEALLDLSCFCH